MREIDNQLQNLIEALLAANKLCMTEDDVTWNLAHRMRSQLIRAIDRLNKLHPAPMDESYMRKIGKIQ